LAEFSRLKTTDSDSIDLGVWGAAVLRPYKIMVRREFCRFREL
jgi:hypothetical protein